MYRVRAESRMGETSLGSDTSFVLVEVPKVEYFDAKMHQSTLARVAKETGGQFYTPETISTLPEDLTYTKSGATTLQQLDLWDMPAIFMLLLGLVGAEWGYRRLKGLA
jgi:hypothetical protein